MSARLFLAIARTTETIQAIILWAVATRFLVADRDALDSPLFEVFGDVHSYTEAWGLAFLAAGAVVFAGQFMPFAWRVGISAVAVFWWGYTVGFLGAVDTNVLAFRIVSGLLAVSILAMAAYVVEVIVRVQENHGP